MDSGFMNRTRFSLVLGILWTRKLGRLLVVQNDFLVLFIGESTRYEINRTEGSQTWRSVRGSILTFTLTSEIHLSTLSICII